MSRLTFGDQIRICQTCSQKFRGNQANTANKFCSRDCYWKSLKGKNPDKLRAYQIKGKKPTLNQLKGLELGRAWNKGTKGVCKPNKGSFKKSKNKVETEIGWYKQITVNGKLLYEHRYIMQKFLGRELKTNEHVHHINRNIQDNRIENLVVLLNSEHSKLTVSEILERGIKCD